jgi:cardiolipin synthase A/B
MERGHHIDLLQGSQELFPALVQAFDQAKYSIRQETYIFDFHGSGQDVAHALIRAAERGVRVKLVVDAVGTGPVPQEWLARFDRSGVRVRVYNPLGRAGFLRPSRWRRVHRKLCVIDGSTAHALGFCGGINVLDDFHDPNHGALAKPRFDFAVRVRGPLVDDMLNALGAVWLSLGRMQKLKAMDLQGAVRGWTKSTSTAADEHQPGAIKAALVLRDNTQHRKTIERTYLRAIADAKQEIIIANAYFLPGGKLRRALVKAAQRGVSVKLLLQGKYEYFMQYHAARPVYAALLKAGIEVHEYSASFLHAKVAVVDAATPHAWATVGSSNLDPLSLLLAREANVVVGDFGFAQQLRAELVYAILHEGQQLDAHEFANRGVLQRSLDWLAYGLMRLALSITGKRY